MATQPEYRDALFNPSDSRSNFKQIIAKRSDLVRFAGGRLGPSQVGQYLYAGTVLGFAATGGDAGYYKPYNAANTDGSQTAVGVLSEDAGPVAPWQGGGGPGDGSEISVIKEGDLFQALLIGLDAGAITNMSGKSYTEHGNTLLSIRA